MNLIGINGYIGSGKDTVGQIIQDLTTPPVLEYKKADDIEWDRVMENCHNTWVIKKYAYKLKQIASIMLGVPPEKFEDQEFKKSILPYFWDRMTVREFLQKLGTEAIRDGVHKNAWVNALFADYKPESKWIITDCRFPNEAQGIKDRGGIVVRINRTLAEVPYQTLEQRHPSETSLDDWNFDWIMPNNGTKEKLRDEVAEMLYFFRIKTVVNS